MQGPPRREVHALALRQRERSVSSKDVEVSVSVENGYVGSNRDRSDEAINESEGSAHVPLPRDM